MNQAQVTRNFEDLKLRLQDFDDLLKNINTNPKGLLLYREALKNIARDTKSLKENISKLDFEQQKEFEELDKDVDNTLEAISGIMEAHYEGEKVTLETITNLKSYIEHKEKQREEKENLSKVSKEDLSEIQQHLESISPQKEEAAEKEGPKEAISDAKKEWQEKRDMMIKTGKTRTGHIAFGAVALFAAAVVMGSTALAIGGAVVALVMIVSAIVTEVKLLAHDMQKQDIAQQQQPEGRGR